MKEIKSTLGDWKSYLYLNQNTCLKIFGVIFSIDLCFSSKLKQKKKSWDENIIKSIYVNNYHLPHFLLISFVVSKINNSNHITCAEFINDWQRVFCFFFQYYLKLTDMIDMFSIKNPKIPDTCYYQSVIFRITKVYVP